MCDILNINFGIGSRVKSDEFGIGVICTEKDAYDSYMVEFSTQNEKLHRNGCSRRHPKTFYNFNNKDIIKLVLNYNKRFEKFINKRIMVPNLGYGNVINDFSTGNILIKLEDYDYTICMSHRIGEYLLKVQGGN